MNKISVRIGGPAGAGIMQAGLMFSKACTRIGLSVFDYIEYPSLIRGGHNTYQIRAEEETVRSQIKHVDVLIALDEPTLTIHAHELGDDSLVLFDPASVNPEGKVTRGILCPVPLKELATAAGGTEIMQNTVALAAAFGILDYPFDTFADIIRDSFDAKKKEIADLNVDVARRGYEHTRQHYGQQSHFRLKPVKAERRMVMTGNEAIALGAIKAGMKFFAAYPMTPASSILHCVAAWGEKYGVVVKHAEDEISVANMGVGAGFAGARAMVATSGGGFALMNEALSLAAISETPLVFAIAMRPGPATGMPTWTEQGDLQHALHAGHGEFPRFVLAAGDIEEAFWLTIEAFNIAEKYQTPVIILTDKYLSESHGSAFPFDQRKATIERGKLLRTAPKGYLRYKDAQDGVSARTIPGVKDGLFLGNSYEHDEYGWTREEAEHRIQQVDKRARKEESYRKEMPQPALVGAKDADLTIVSWGSTKGPILDAMGWLAKEGHKVNLLQMTHIAPFPAETVAKILKNAKRTLLIENNSLGQLGQVIRQETGIELTNKYLRYDGRPFWPEDIYARIKGELE